MSDELWQELRFHRIYIDGAILELPDWKVMGAPELSDVLNSSLKRERVVIRVSDRVRGTVTYTKRGEQGRLSHELDGFVKHARPQHPGQGFDALFIFWEYGELSPFVRWSSQGRR